MGLLCGVLASACLGPKGEKGDPGAPGVTGQPGPTGATGRDGTNGQNGTNGADGADGDAGRDGTNGTDGANGTDGRSAYLTADGVVLTLNSAAISNDGTASVDFKLTDPNGLPLDVNGLYTANRVQLGFVLAYLPVDSNDQPLPYVAFTTRADAGTLADVDVGGSLVEIGVAQGRYRYTFHTRADPSKNDRTHTVAAWAIRAGSVFGATLHFIPRTGDAGSPRAVVSNGACNQCHGTLRAHQGTRSGVEGCVTCHTPQSTDPVTGNTLDFTVMIHKLHMGSSLPSVRDGGVYGLNTSDWSSVAFPRDVGECVSCHAGGAQADRWQTSPSEAGCVSCHDDVVFATPGPGQRQHDGGVVASQPCGGACHGSTAGSAPITTAHQPPARPVIQLAIRSMTNTSPGSTPVMVFSVSVDGVPRDLFAAKLDRLAATMAGPSTDVSSVSTFVIQAPSGSTTGTLTAVDASNGVFSYTFPTPMAANAQGTYAVGLEAYLKPGNERFWANTPVTWFAVTDPTPVARRTSIATEKCQSCHAELVGHGYRLRSAEYCLLCHTPSLTNASRVARVEGTSVLARSLNFKDLVHAVHRGTQHTVTPFIIGGLPAPSAANPQGTPTDLSKVRYPADLRDCTACHVSKASVELPLPTSAAPSKSETFTCTESPADDANEFCDAPYFTSGGVTTTPPETAACVSCHDDPAVATHAAVNTFGGLESCAVCHASGKSSGLDVVHAVRP